MKAAIHVLKFVFEFALEFVNLLAYGDIRLGAGRIAYGGFGCRARVINVGLLRIFFERFAEVSDRLRVIADSLISGRSLEIIVQVGFEFHCLAEVFDCLLVFKSQIIPVSQHLQSLDARVVGN